MAALHLAPREKRLVALMMMVMIGLITFFIHQKVAKALEKSEAQLEMAQRNLSDATLFSETIISGREGQRAIQAMLNARARSFDLYAFSNQCIASVKLQDRATLKSVGLPSKDKAFDGVQITLKNINMQELVDFLHIMYNSNNLIMMKKMSYLRPSRDKKGLECSLEMHSPKR